MARFIRRIHARILAPAQRTLTLGLRFNALVWTKYFDDAWDAIPLHEKLTWILFISNTLAILTLIQFLAFK